MVTKLSKILKILTICLPYFKVIVVHLYHSLADGKITIDEIKQMVQAIIDTYERGDEDGSQSNDDAC